MSPRVPRSLPCVSCRARSIVRFGSLDVPGCHDFPANLHLTTSLCVPAQVVGVGRNVRRVSRLCLARVGALGVVLQDVVGGFVDGALHVQARACA